MRVFSSLVLVAWLLGGTVAPCLGGAVCASTAKSTCCCGSADECCCHLAARTPVPSSTIIAVPTVQDPQGMPAADAAPVADIAAASAQEDVPPTRRAPVLSSAIYLDTRTIRC